MRNESDNRNLVIVDDGAVSGLVRWAPVVVVVSVIAGFIALSWYAYHAGIQSLKDEDLLVVEADKTPLKEKPLDPGGMKFPNQDKTIFDTFAGNTQPPLKVERVLPKPEEPIKKDLDTSDTSTWINEKLQKHSQETPPVAKEKVIGAEDKPIEKVSPAPQEIQSKSLRQVPDSAGAHHQVIAAETAADEAQSETYVAHKSVAKAEPAADNTAADTTQAPDVPAPKKAQMLPEKPAEKAKEDIKEKTHAPAAGKVAVQLGAFRSEKELNDAWAKMHLKQKELSDKEPLIIKADLGSKGIYYRLRVGGLASAAEAKALCGALSAKGQACIIAVDK